MNTVAFDPTLPQTFITPEGKRVKRVIRHRGQGIDSHVVYGGKRFDIKHIQGNLWMMI